MDLGGSAADPLGQLAGLLRTVTSEPFGVVMIGGAPDYAPRGAIECDARGGVAASARHADDSSSVTGGGASLRSLLAAPQPRRITEAPEALGLVLPRSAHTYRGVALLPVILDGRLDHWVLLLATCDDQFADAQLQQAFLLANLVCCHTARVQQLGSLRQASDWIRGELASVARLQRLLLPRRETLIRGMRFAASYRPCEHAGGDYYDLISLTHVFGDEQAGEGADVWGLMVADSAGHGAAAAVEVAMYDAILRTYRAPHREAGAAEVFNYANPYLFTRISRGTFMTACGAVFRPATGGLLYCSAGHPSPMVRRAATGAVEELTGGGGIPLGILRDNVWENGVTRLAKGDVLVIYTDGVIEARAPAGAQFGKEGLMAVLRDGDTDPDNVARRIERAIETHQQELPRRDDQTVVVVRQEGGL